jgi:acetyl esterase/lipase
VRGRAVRGVAVLLAFAAVLAGCGGVPKRERPPELGSLTTSGAGTSFYEVYESNGPARGTLLVIHGGGWKSRRGDARRMMASASLAVRATGWRVVDIDYRSGQARGKAGDPRTMLGDVVAFYDQVRRAYRGPVCAYGESAGGHLAAMLAIERPSLDCAALAAAPLDLPTLLHESTREGAQQVRRTFGTSKAALAAWSPARRWDVGAVRTRVFATAASNDAIVPPQQLTAFVAAVPRTDARVVPGATAGAADAVPWMHSTVRRNAIVARLVSFAGWLDGVGRAPEEAPEPAASTGSDCGMLPRQRWRLLRAGDAWRPASTAGQPIVATRGCSGSARWQDDGLSLWASPSPGGVLREGAEASLVLSGDHVVRRLAATFRGFLARPRDWEVGIYASGRARGDALTEVAGCDRGRCRGLRLVATRSGALIAAAGSRGDPDRREEPAAARFALPPGTHRVAWRLRCAAPGGCSLAGIAGANGSSARPRDPLGHPAIFSLYSVDVR